MTETTDLSGKKILVVEDEYYLATDIARALKAAGAKILRPSPDADAALDVLAEETPSVVLLDINLSDRADFRVAAELVKRRSPSCLRQDMIRKSSLQSFQCRELRRPA